MILYICLFHRVPCAPPPSFLRHAQTQAYVQTRTQARQHELPRSQSHQSHRRTIRVWTRLHISVCVCARYCVGVECELSRAFLLPTASPFFPRPFLRRPAWLVCGCCFSLTHSLSTLARHSFPLSSYCCPFCVSLGLVYNATRLLSLLPSPALPRCLSSFT